MPRDIFSKFRDSKLRAAKFETLELSFDLGRSKAETLKLNDILKMYTLLGWRSHPSNGG